MENSDSRDSKMSEKKRNSQSGKFTVNTTSDQRPRCFRDIMDLVLHLSDEEWKAVSRGMSKEVSRLEFAAASTKIVTTVSSVVIHRLLKPLSEIFGIGAIVEANDKLKEMAESKSSESASYASGQRSPMEVSDFICDLAQKIITEIKGAMLEAIQSTASDLCSETASSDSVGICERQQAVSEKSKTLLDACNETDSELDVSTENVQEFAAAGQFLDNATQVASSILVNKLTSEISSGLICRKGSGSSTAPSSTPADLNRVVSGSMNKMIGITDSENRLAAWVGEAQVSDADCSSAPYTKSCSVFSSRLQSLSGLEETILEAESEPLPSGQKSQYVPLYLFTVVRDQLKAFFTSCCKSAADDKATDPSAHSESEEDHVVPIHIDEEGSVHELDIGRSLSDSVLVRKTSMLCSVQFPPLLLYRFVEESTRALLQNVLNTGESDGMDGPEDQEKKERPRVRFVVKTYRHVVVKRPKKQKKQRRVPLPQGDQPSTSTSACLLEDSHGESKPSRSIFKNTRRTLGRIFSNISKTFTGIFKNKRSRNSSE